MQYSKRRSDVIEKLSTNAASKLCKYPFLDIIEGCNSNDIGLYLNEKYILDYGLF